MSSITILHVSDLHYDPKKSEDQGIVLNAFFRDVSRLRQDREIKPDIAVFSGDLVQAGEAAEAFSEAHQHFVGRLMEELGLPGERFFIVPGNHDINRPAVRRAEFIEVGLKAALDKPEATNALVDQVLAGENQVALERLRCYQDYVETNLARPHALSNQFVTIDKLDVCGVRTAVACFNTAWRSTGEGGLVDNKNLLIGERVVDLALKHTADAELSVALFHHPLEWLQDNDFMKVEGLLHSSFDLLLFGHLHLARPVATTTPDGSTVLSQAGCLYSRREYFNGYSVIMVDAKLRTIKVMLRTYQPRRREFDIAVDVAPEGQIEFPWKDVGRKTDANEIEDFLKVARRVVRMKGNRHIATLAGVDPEICDIKQLFVCPPLSIDPERRRGMVENDGLSDKRALGYETLLRDDKNYVIYGARETGKTSLAHYLAVRTSEGISDRVRIPVVFDFSQIRFGTSRLWRRVRNYFSDVESGPLQKELFLNSLVVFLDNFQNEAEEDGRVFAALQEQAPGARWVCLGEESFAAVMREARPQGFGIAYIEPLPRRTIRELSRRWSVQMGRDGQKAYEAVMTQLQRANLPRTGYIVALLLWAMHRSREHRQLNEAVLLENVVEHLLEKADFTRALRKAFDYRAKEITLQSVAGFLKERQNYADINEVLAHLIGFFRTNGLVYSASDVLQKLIESGVLDRTGDSVHFKYKCFQDYFMAGCIAEEPGLFDSLFDGYDFTRYGREIELLSGKDRRRCEILQRLSTKLDALRPEEFRKAGDSFEKLDIGEKMQELAEEMLLQVRSFRLKQEQIDDVMDFADEKMRELINKHQGSLNDERMRMKLRYFETLDLYGKVLRNLEFIPVGQKRKHLRSFLEKIVDFTVAMRRKGIDSIEELAERMEKQGQPDRDQAIRCLEYYVKVMLPTSALGGLMWSVATPKLEPLMEDVVNDDRCELGAKLASLFAVLDIEAQNGIGLWREFAKNEGRNRYARTLMLSRLGQYYSANPLEKVEKEGLENLIGDIVVGRGQPKQLKGRVISELRRRRRIADAGAKPAGGDGY